MTTTHPRTALLLQRVDENIREKSTLEQILDSPAVKGYAKDEALSQSQKGLVAITVSLMQDRLLKQLRGQADDLRETLERERYMFTAIFAHTADGLKQLYQTRMFQLSRHGDQEPNISNPPEKKDTFLSVFTWGNTFAAAAIITVAIALYFTKAYSSYKDRVENQSQTITDLTSAIAGLRAEKVTNEQQIKSMLEESTRLNGQIELWTATANQRGKSIDTLTQELKQQAGQVVDVVTLRDQITKLNSDLLEANALIASMRSEARSQIENRSVYKDMYDKEYKRNGEFLSGYNRLDKENNQLKRDLEFVQSQLKKKNR